MLLAVVLSSARVANAQQLGVRVPEGFEVSLYADDDLAHDIYSLTIDSVGRVVVSGAGYVRILLDTDSDGRADSFKQYADGPHTGAQGMYFDGRDLLCSGDAGLIRYRDSNSDDRADGPPETLLKIKAGGEHHAHAIRKGPDGWWWLMAGNMAGVDESYVTSPNSPIKKPNAGVLLRLSPDFQKCEVVADGFRNAYDFDFNEQGDIFTYDSDGEREVSLPWYQPTRVFHVLPGSNAGWFSRSWKRPDYFPEMPPVLARLGRGSPTGVVCYRHTLFPEKYRGALFVLDWTFGRVVAITPKPSGAGFRAEPVSFMTGVGQFGFAPSDIEVGPDGALYVSIGGRGTRGGVYRIAPAGGAAPENDDPPKTEQQKLAACLDAPQPLSSWSRRVWEPLAGELGKAPFVQVDRDVDLSQNSFSQRQRGQQILRDVFATKPQFAGRGYQGFSDSSERRSRGGPSTSEFHRIGPTGPEALLTSLQALKTGDALVSLRIAQIALGDFDAGGKHPPVFDGYQGRRDLSDHPDIMQKAIALLEQIYPLPVSQRRDETINHELARLIAMLAPNSPTLLEKVLDQIGEASHPTDDIHHLIVAARIPVQRSLDQRQTIAAALVGLEAKIESRGLYIDNNFEPRMTELYDRLVELDALLPAALISRQEFGRGGHTLFLKHLAADQYKQAIDRIASRSEEAGDDFPWSSDIIFALARTGDSSHLQLVRRQFENFAVRDAVLLALARRPRAIDRSKFAPGLESSQLNVIAACSAALQKLPPSSEAGENVALLLALRRLGADRSEYPVRDDVALLLRRNMRQEFGYVTGNAGRRPQPEAIEKWTSYVSRRFPEEAQSRLGGGGDNLAQFRELLAQADFSNGDAQRGKTIFAKRSCAQCHGSRRALGPDLAGVARRFSRDDLFTAIAAPSRDVSPRYQTTLVETNDGKAYAGLVVYVSVDGLTLLSGTNQMHRIESDEIASQRKLPTSLMPAGLLNDATPADLADLYAYLQILGTERVNR